VRNTRNLRRSGISPRLLCGYQKGETFVEVKERAYNAVLKLLKENDPGTIIVVAHGGTIRAIICGLLDIDLNHAFRIEQDNTALNIIQYDQGFISLSLLNDTNHLTKR